MGVEVFPNLQCHSNVNTTYVYYLFKRRLYELNLVSKITSTYFNHCYIKFLNKQHYITTLHLLLVLGNCVLVLCSSTFKNTLEAFFCLATKKLKSFAPYSSYSSSLEFVTEATWRTTPPLERRSSSCCTSNTPCPRPPMTLVTFNVLCLVVRT